MRDTEIIQDPNIVYDQYQGSQQQVFSPPPLPGSVAISNLNGLTGPTITISGGTTGLTFSPAGATITLIGTLVPANGGTGISSYAQGDLLYASGATTLAKLAKSATATRYLSNTGSSNNPAWAAIDLTNGVTGVLPNANGGMVKINSAAVAPTVTDDTAAGYSVNSLWTDTVLDDAYICVDSTNGSAVWKKITP